MSGRRACVRMSARACVFCLRTTSLTTSRIHASIRAHLDDILMEDAAVFCAVYNYKLRSTGFATGCMTYRCSQRTDTRGCSRALRRRTVSKRWRMW